MANDVLNCVGGSDSITQSVLQRGVHTVRWEHQRQPAGVRGGPRHGGRRAAGEVCGVAAGRARSNGQAAQQGD